MQRIQRADGTGKRLERAGKHRRRQLDESHAAHEGANLITVRTRQLPRVDSRPDLVLEEAAGDQRLSPECFGRYPVFRQQVGEGDGGVVVKGALTTSSAGSSVRRPR